MRNSDLDGTDVAAGSCHTAICYNIVNIEVDIFDRNVLNDFVLDLLSDWLGTIE